MSPPGAPTGAGSDAEAGQQPPAVQVTPPGPQSMAAARRLERVECPAFGRRRRERMEDRSDALPIVLSAGRGSNLWDVDDNRYVDLVAGFGAVVLGHGAPALQRALEDQSRQLVQGLGDVYGSEMKVALLERLAALHPGHAAQVLLGQTGSDAVTAAMKTATLATGRPGFVAFEGAYHGLGMGPLPACGLRASYRAPFAAQLNPWVRFAPYPGLAGTTLDQSLSAVEQVLHGDDVAAILVEPVLGRGGCVVPPSCFVAELGTLACDHGALLIADEVWTGMGRSGALLRTVELAAPADLLCIGKGLGGGLPISACIAPEAIMAAWSRETEVIHTSTHSGAPLGCAAALATLDAVQREQLDRRAAHLGAKMLTTWADELSRSAAVVEVRGVGLMLGIELDSAARAQATARALLERGYLVLTGGETGNVLTLTPALNVAEELLAGLGAALAEVLEP